VNVADPIALLFGGMKKLGPGANEQTLQVLRRLPRKRFDLVVDAGCGATRPSHLWRPYRRNGYLLGSYRIATAPEPNSSRPTSFKSTCFDSPANK
jgi:hypothetical protein